MTCESYVRNGRLHFCGELNIYSAAEIKDQIIDYIRSGTPQYSVDLSEVSELDTAGIQGLLMLRRAAQACGKSLVIVSPSAAARDVMELCGLESLLERRSERGAQA